MSWISLPIAFAIALIHLLARSKLIRKLMDGGWILSGAGGLTVAYVFVHLLPELGEHQDVLEKQKDKVSYMHYLDHYAYIVALAGLLLYFGIERLAKSSKQKKGPAKGSSNTVFWLHIGSFFLFNGIVGYLLVDRFHEKTPLNLLLYGFATGLHFLVVDHTLSGHHSKKYENFGRWILSAAVLFGWAAGKWLPIPKPAFALLFAFLSGAILMNVLKEELPQQKRNNYWAFLLGALVYTVLLQVTQ